MEEKAYKNLKKNMEQPWINEPNFLKLNFSGFQCRIKRTDLGTLCGYIALPHSHPYAFFSNEELDEELALAGCSVHGGITFSELYRKGYEDLQIEKQNDEDDFYVIGFDRDWETNA